MWRFAIRLIQIIMCTKSPVSRFCSLLTASFFLIGSSAYADDLPDLGESARAELSPQIERRIGENIMNEIRLREPSYVDDPEINDYLTRIGRRLVSASANPTGDFHFFAIRDNTINAFAMFGGFIGINTGTLLAAQTESELAGVIAHEIAHVTQNHLARQIAKEKQNTIPALIAMAAGILVARSNSSAAAAAVTSAQAGMVQAQLAYTRDFEREADRMGFQTLEKAGFDARSLGDFFERLQKNTRLYENNAPVYLRSHPLTVERISDMQNRAQESPYRQVVSSDDFHLLRVKLRVQALTPKDAVSEFQNQLREKKYGSVAAAHYGLALALLSARDVAGAQRAYEQLETLKLSSPLAYGLGAAINTASGDHAGAQRVFREALQRFPEAKALVYGYAESLYAARLFDQALSFLDAQIRADRSDYKLFGLQAKTYAALGKRLQQHSAQAEHYLLQGQLGQAVEQLQFAQQSADGNFYEQSAVDARLRELRKLQAEEEKMKRNGG
ncbi:beta-barrel assembly-enhancing protease [Propionivibrio limicola]|uniref:beta-barrel assembly-enhancing protease n=1 Tax=Propionivibrio limicola TaxID=167645 RepID=UPI001FE6EEDA|nr:M48 family metalloprotease [Propionivibrio limicola]